MPPGQRQRRLDPLAELVVTEKLASRTVTLTATMVAAAIGIVGTTYWGVLTDKVGRRPVYLLGTAVVLAWGIPLFLVVNSDCPGPDHRWPLRLGRPRAGRAPARRPRRPGLPASAARRGVHRARRVRLLIPARQGRRAAHRITGVAFEGDRKTQLVPGIPVGRNGIVHDVADLITYLCRAESGYIIGVTYDVNGGSYIH